MPITKVISYGARHGKPEGCYHVDVRTRLTNPWQVAKLRRFTGLDDQVKHYITKTAGFDPLIQEILKAIPTLRESPSVLAIGCTGGRHRSVVVAEEIAKRLGVPVEHRDINKGGYAKE